MNGFGLKECSHQKLDLIMLTDTRQISALINNHKAIFRRDKH
jgi:hypothetical protein